MSEASSWRGIIQPLSAGSSEGPTTCHFCQPAPSGPSWPGLSNERGVLPLRPEWVICVAASAPSCLRKRTSRLWPSIWLSSHMPRSPWVTRPRGSMAQFSVKTMPNLPSANLPRWTRW